MTTPLPTGTEYFLTIEQQTRLATVLDKEINIPLFKDHREPAVFLKFVQSIDRNMRKFTPDEILAAALKKDLQIEDEVADILKKKLVPHLVDLLPIPFLPKILKEKALNLALDIIVGAMAGMTNIDETIEDFFMKVFQNNA